MLNLKRKNGFKVFIFAIIQLFLISNIAFAVMDQEEKILSSRNQTEDAELQSSPSQPPVTAYSEFSTQGISTTNTNMSNTTEEVTDPASVVDAMEDSPISSKAVFLKASGATAGEAVSILLEKKYSTEEISTELVKAGYSESSVNNFISKYATPGASVPKYAVNPDYNNSSTGQDNAIRLPNPDHPDNKGNVMFTDDITNASQSAKNDIVNAVENARNFFQELGFDKRTVNICVRPPEDGKGGEAQLSQDSDYLLINIYATTDEDGNYVHPMPDGSTSGIPEGGMQHEYAHLVYEAGTGGGFDHSSSSDSVNQAQVLNEGFAGYFGELVGGDDGEVPPGAMGQAIEDYKTVLQGIAEDIGQDTANQIIYDSASEMGGDFTYSGAMNAIIKADQKLTGGANAGTIRQHFNSLV